jgi:protein-S-isoprenylcysteine O-methyltransferase Ste14
MAQLCRNQNTAPTTLAAAGFFRQHIRAAQEGEIVLVLGVVLLVLGLLLPVPPVVTTIGVILLVLGAVLWVLGAAGHSVGGRRYWW